MHKSTHEDDIGCLLVPVWVASQPTSSTIKAPVEMLQKKTNRKLADAGQEASPNTGRGLTSSKTQGVEHCKTPHPSRSVVNAHRGSRSQT